MHTNEQFRWMGVCLKWPGLRGTHEMGRGILIHYSLI